MPDLVLMARLVCRAYRYKWKLCRPEIAAMCELLPVGGVAIDVGAHKGGFSWSMARAVGPRGTVIAIEPQSRVTGPTARAFAAAGMKHVRVIQAAASDQPGESQIAMRTRSTHGASLTGIEGRGVENVRVPVVTVDGVAEDHKFTRVDFIKIDTEGHERAVLSGAARVIERFRPSLLVEIEARHHHASDAAQPADPVREITELLRDSGYDGWFFPASGRATLVSQFDASVHQVYGQGTYSNNFLFTQPGKM